MTCVSSRLHQQHKAQKGFSLTEPILATASYKAHLCAAHTSLWLKVSSGVLGGLSLLTLGPSALQTIATIEFGHLTLRLYVCMHSLHCHARSAAGNHEKCSYLVKAEANRVTLDSCSLEAQWLPHGLHARHSSATVNSHSLQHASNV